MQGDKCLKASKTKQQFKQLLPFNIDLKLKLLEVSQSEGPKVLST